MNKKRILYKVICIIVLPAMCITAAVHAAKVFTFNPPDGQKGSVTVVTTTRRQFNDGQPVVDVVDKTWDLTFKKKEGHFVLTWTPVSVKTSRDGREFIHPVHTVLHQFPITYTIDPGGKILSVEGLSGVQAALEGKVPENAWHSLAPLVSEEMLTGIEIGDWKVLVEDCMGRPASTGTCWHNLENQGMAKRQGRLYFRYVQVKQPVHYAGKDLLMLEEWRYSDLEALQKITNCKGDGFSKKEIEQMRSWEGEEGVRVEVEGSGYRIVDPDTMLIYAASLTQEERKYFSNGGGKESVLSLKETREYRFTYN